MAGLDGSKPVLTVRQETIKLKRGKIGLISDTHGLIRPEALMALKGSELIIHAGDIGKPEVIHLLNDIAPVLAIRGNVDREPWARQIPDMLNLNINSIKLHVIHNRNEMTANPVAAGFLAVVSGHSHMPGKVKRDGILYINPGSAGPRRFKLPIAVGLLYISGIKLRGSIIELST